jgi:hypothetical protein
MKKFTYKYRDYTKKKLKAIDPHFKFKEACRIVGEHEDDTVDNLVVFMLYYSDDFEYHTNIYVEEDFITETLDITLSFLPEGLSKRIDYKTTVRKGMAFQYYSDLVFLLKLTENRTINRYNDLLVTNKNLMCKLNDYIETRITTVTKEKIVYKEHPDREAVLAKRRENLQNSVAYIMYDEVTGYYKLGKSIRPSYRERTLQSEKPTIILIHTFKTDCEKYLHLKYSNKRVRGEWFSLSNEDVVNIKQNFN